LDVEENGGLLPAIRELMLKVYLPTIQAMSNWGSLTETPHGKKTKEAFIHNLESFVHYLDSKFFVVYWIIFSNYGQKTFNIFCKSAVFETANALMALWFLLPEDLNTLGSTVFWVFSRSAPVYNCHCHIVGLRVVKLSMQTQITW